MHRESIAKLRWPVEVDGAHFKLVQSANSEASGHEVALQGVHSAIVHQLEVTSQAFTHVEHVALYRRFGCRALCPLNIEGASRREGHRPSWRVRLSYGLSGRGDELAAVL